MEETIGYRELKTFKLLVNDLLWQSNERYCYQLIEMNQDWFKWAKCGPDFGRFWNINTRYTNQLSIIITLQINNNTIGGLDHCYQIERCLHDSIPSNQRNRDESN